MKQIHEVSHDKLRGGFYTSPPVVDYCVQRALGLFQRNGHEPTWLEPSAGDGAFLQGIARAHQNRAKPKVTAIELDAAEATKCAKTARSLGLDVDLVRGSFFDWAADNPTEFDLLVGNPPFVRYQFVPKRDQELFAKQLHHLGVEVRGVSNLWIPFAILGLARIRPGGAFAMVLPSELVCTVSGQHFRTFLAREFAAVRVDLFPRGTFADLMQDVVVVSGRRTRQSRGGDRVVEFAEHHAGSETRWKHRVPESGDAWSRCFLTTEELDAYDAACRLPGIHRLGAVAKLEVSIVTGANSFFTVDDEARRAFALTPWARPLLARTADCPGIVFKETDHQAAIANGSRAWLLDFGIDRPSPSGLAEHYLAAGKKQGLHERYKCRIREPWYRVPQIKAGTLMMTKRAHLHHRLLLNDMGVLTTDTVYRGEMLQEHANRARDLVAGFQSTLSLLSTELEGRTYGGGVLELVPSEIARLRVPLVEIGKLLPALDKLSRRSNGQRDSDEAVRSVVDDELSKRVPGLGELLPLLRTARERLVARRLRH